MRPKTQADRDNDKFERFKLDLQNLQDFELTSINFGKSSQKVVKAILDEIKRRNLNTSEKMFVELKETKKEPVKKQRKSKK